MAGEANFIIPARPWQNSRGRTRDSVPIGGSFLPLSGGAMTGDILVAAADSVNLGSSTLYWSNIYTVDLFAESIKERVGAAGIRVTGDLSPITGENHNLGGNDRWTEIHGTSMFADNWDDGGSARTLVKTDWQPQADDTFDLGAPTATWAEIHGETFFVQNSMRTTANLGTLNTGVTVSVEFGDGRYHLSALNISQVDALTLGDNVALADGYLLYTFPAGVIVVDFVRMDIAILAASAQQTGDTPDVGIGTQQASGAVSVLSGTAAFENLLTGQTATDCNGTKTLKTLTPTANIPLVIEAGDSHTVYFNVANTWSDDTGEDLTANLPSGSSIFIGWHFLI